MPRKATGKPNGRPKKAVRIQTVKALAGKGLTHSEIAVAIGVSLSTLTKREGFYDEYSSGKETFTASLRRAQFKKAMSGDTQMLKHMGANYLNQSDRIRQEISGHNGGPIMTADLTKLSDDQLSNLEHILAAASPEPGSGQD